MTRLRKLVAGLLCLAMLAAFVPAGVSLAADSRSNSEYDWRYTITITTSSKNEAGSGDTKSLVYKKHGSDNVSSIGSFSDNISTNSTFSKMLYSDVAPWEIEYIGVGCGSSNALCVLQFSVTARFQGSTGYSKGDITLLTSTEGLYAAAASKDQGWIGGKSSDAHPSAIFAKINSGSVISSNAGVDSIGNTLSGTTVLDMAAVTASSTETVSVLWDCMIQDQYSRYYNVFDYSSSPSVKFSGAAVGTSNASSGKTFDLTGISGYSYLATIKSPTSESGDAIGFTFDKWKMLSFMNWFEINTVTITTSITFSKGRLSANNVNSDGNKISFDDEGKYTIEWTYTIIRGAFTIDTENVEYSDNYSLPAEESNYYYSTTYAFTTPNGNSGHGTLSNKVKVTVPILMNDSNNTHLNSTIHPDWMGYSALFSVGGRTLECSSAKLQLGNSDVYIDAKSSNVTINSKGKAVFEFTIPDGADSNDQGLTLLLEGAHISVPISVYNKGDGTLGENAVDFWLYNIYTSSQNTYGSISILESEHKVDRLEPTVEASAIEGEFGKWTNSLKLSIETSETLYDPYQIIPAEVDSTSSGIYSTDAGLFSSPQFTYWLNKIVVDSDGQEHSSGYAYILNNGEPNTGKYRQTALAASGGSAKELTIKLSSVAEGKYTLVIFGRDRANNFVYHEVKDLYLDNKPPVVNMTTSGAEVTVDKKLKQEFLFDVTDISLESKIYYYIDTTGKGPASDYTIGATDGDEISGVMESLYDQWVFLNQTDNDTSTTDGAAVISLDPGEEFEGRIYYLAVDSSGNTTSTYYDTISLNNVSLDCEISYSAIDNVKDYEITLDNAAGTSVTYRWLNSSRQAITGSKPYTGPFLASEAWGDAEAWSGYYYLEYTVTAISGASTSAKAPFFFDNSAPIINITDSDAAKYTDSHRLKITVSDESVISKATAQFFIAEGEAVSEEISLIDADSNGAYSISENLIFGTEDEIEPGVYRMKVRACDENGNECEETSQLIQIRKYAPAMTVTASADKTYGEDETPLLGAGDDYTLTISLSESFIHPELAPVEINEKQYAYYRITGGNQSHTSAWTFLGEMTASEETNEFKGEFTLTTPRGLAEGKNNMMIETIVVTEGRTLYANDRTWTVGNTAARVAAGSFTIYYDTTVPTYYLDLEDERTGGNIVGTLRINDKYSTEFTIESDNEAITAELVEGDVYTVEEEDGVIITWWPPVMPYAAKYTVTVTENTSGNIIITDAAGNKVTVPVKVEKIDREAPTAEMTGVDYRQSGERTDAYATVELSNVQRGTMIWGVIPAEEIDDAVASGSIDDKYFTDYDVVLKATALWESDTRVDNEIDAGYEILLGGGSGGYYLCVRAEDTLGNVSDTIFDEAITIVDAEPTMTLVSVTPKEAGSRAMAKLTMNVPLFVLLPQIDPGTVDQDSVEMANLLIAESYASVCDYMEEYSWIVTDNGEYDFYVLDELGRSSKIVVEIPDDFVTFGHELNEPIVSKFQTTNTYTWSGRELISSEEKAVDDDAYLTGYSIYMYPDETYETYAELSSYIRVEAVPLEDGTQTYLMPLSGDFDDDYEYNGLVFCRDLSAECAFGYTEMVFEVAGTASSEGTRSVDIYVTTEERFQYGASDWDIVNIFVDKIEDSAPVSTTIYDPIANDPYSGSYAYTMDDVIVDIYMSDPQTGVTEIEINGWGYITDLETYAITEADINLIIPLIDDTGNGIDYETEPYTFENEFVKIEVYSDTDTTSTKRMHMTIHENSYYSIVAYNAVGLDEWVQYDREGIMVENISRVPLRDEDYTLTYYYLDNNGDWQAVDPNDETTYFKQGKAVIELTDSENEREIYVANNGGEWERSLNIMSNSYTFLLRDKYGYSLEVDASLLNFDETAGSITYSIGSIAADNSAPLEITAYDSQSGVASTTLTHAGITETLTETSVDENGVYTYNKSLTSSGTYIITMTDKVGNSVQKVFSVSSIDTETPEIANVKYSTNSLTSKTVSAAITFTKSNVKITNAYSAQDNFKYSVNTSSSIIYFEENGTLNIEFEDSYGNVGYGTVGVSWIYTTPPALEAVMEVADDCQTVDVTFIKATDENGVPIDQKRELTDIIVYYAGNIQRVKSVDDDGNVVDARYTFIKNGEYTFTVYDDEGLTSYLTIEITGIDTEAPQITQVTWTYNYDKLNQNGEWETLVMKDEWIPSDEAGYRIYVDDDNPITKYDVDVTIETDMDATLAGKTDYEATTTHNLTYDANGTYIFNFKKPNGTVTSYGFDVEVIDKTPPVIELNATELIFYENEQMNTPYSRDMIDKGFKAYDVFRSTITDLTDRVTIDYGDFDPTEITNNKYDRTKPYTITYSVTDDANNTTEMKMTVRLVALTDTIVMVNGNLPDSANRSYLKGTDEITVTLKNFSGIAYAKIYPGTWSLGQMKTKGTVLPESGDGEFTYTVPKEGWYTIMIQTDKRDYFNLQIAVENIN